MTSSVVALGATAGFVGLPAFEVGNPDPDAPRPRWRGSKGFGHDGQFEKARAKRRSQNKTARANRKANRR